MKKYLVNLYDMSEDKVVGVVEFETKKDMSLKELEKTYDTIRHQWYENDENMVLFDFIQKKLREKDIDMNQLIVDTDFIF